MKVFYLSLAAVIFYPSTLVFAAIFDGAGVTVDDTGGYLSWKAETNALSVYCWFKISVPTGKVINQNMTLLVDRRSGDENSIYSYLIQYNATTGKVEFIASGDEGSLKDGPIILIDRPYLDRWYHVAIIRSDSTFYSFVDGQSLPTRTANIGSTSNTDGICIGSWGNKNFFYGEIQEVAIFQQSIASMVNQLRFLDLEPFQDHLKLKGYYKLNETGRENQFKNYLSDPPENTESGIKVGNGGIEILSADKSVEQSLFDSTKNGGVNAITPLSGAFTWQDIPLSRPVAGIPFEFIYSYSSSVALLGTEADELQPIVLSPGWRHSYEIRMLPTQISGERKIITSSGAIETWILQGGVYKTRHKEYRGTLEKLHNEDFLWTTPDNIKFYFYDPTHVDFPWEENKRGRLYKIEDLNGNSMNLEWDFFSGQLLKVVDPVGGEYDFQYNPQGFLSSVIFNEWAVQFEYDSNKLTSASVTGPEAYSQINSTRTFEYNDEGLLHKLYDPNVLTAFLEVTYDRYGRVVELKDALGNTTKTEYDNPNPRQISRIDENANRWIETYDRKHRVLSMEDPLKNISRFSYDEFGNRISETSPLGHTTIHQYDDRANIIKTQNPLGYEYNWEYHPVFNKITKETNALGWETHFEYDGSGNLLIQQDALGTISSFTYYPNGLVHTATDGNGNASTYTYTNEGFLLTEKDSDDYVTHYQYNDLGWVSSMTNALNQTYTHLYDINGNRIEINDPLGRSKKMKYDERGNLVEETDFKGFKNHYRYNYANQLVESENAIGGITQFEYSPTGKLVKIVDAFNNQTVSSYDKVNRLIKIKDARNQAVTIEYDKDGNEIRRIDQRGNAWQKTYNAINHIVQEINPHGNMLRMEYDKNGRVLRRYSPKGYASTNEYDGRGRLAQWTDPEGYVWLYHYDGNVNITKIVDANGGEYIMLYGSRNERTYEENQDGDTFYYEYDALKRLKKITKPDGVTRTLTYDNGGRLTQISYSTGRVDVFDYDDNNNILHASRTKDGVTIESSYTYDELNRMVSYTDNHSFRVGYEYDVLSRITKLTYPDGKTVTNEYDSVGKLIKQTDWSDRETRYTYDSVGRLTSRTYPNGVVQQIQIDQAGRMTAFSYEMSGGDPFLAYSYAYDRNDNLIASTAQGQVAAVKPEKFDETFTHTPANKLIDKEDAANPDNSFTYTYDDNGNLLTASSPTKTYHLTYDEDNRTASIQLQEGQATTLIQNIYDVSGRRIARKRDGIETRYVLDITGYYEKAIAEADDQNNIVKWFVYGGEILNYSVGNND